MELEIANVSRACGLSGFRYVTFAAPRFVIREPIHAAPDLSEPMAVEWQPVNPSEPEPARPEPARPEPARLEPARSEPARLEPVVMVEAPIPAPTPRPAVLVAPLDKPRFDLLAELAGAIEAPAAPAAPPVISRPPAKARRAPRSASSLVPKL